MTYNKILVPYDSSKLSDVAIEHALKIAKMSVSHSAGDIVNVILFYVTPIINIPFTIETVSFKSNKTGETIALSEYIRELHRELKENAILCLMRKSKKTKIF